MRRITLCILMLLTVMWVGALLPTSNLYAKDFDDTTPIRFKDEQEARQNHCFVVKLKDPAQNTCVHQAFIGHELLLTIYDSDMKGGFIRSQQLCIPSWYQKATVDYKDILGIGTQFIFIEFEGNTGTGTLQKILTIIGWHNGKFVPVLAETVSYDISERESLESLKVDYIIENECTPEVSLTLNYNYDMKNNGVLPGFKAAWSDELNWHNSSYTFYDKVVEKSIPKNATFYIQRNIANSRIALKKVDVNRFCDDFFDKTNIMYVLDEMK